MRRRLCSLVVLLTCCLTPAFSQHVIANIAVGNHPMYLAVDEETNRIYVSNQSDDTVSVINGATNQVLHTIKVGHGPNGVAVNSRTNTIYVANLTGGSLSIVDGTKLTSSTLHLGFNPSKVAVNPSTDRVYVTIENDNGFLDVINGKQRKLIASIKLPPYPLSVAVDSDSNQIYVADFLCGCGRISVVDGATNRVSKTIRLPGASLVGGVALDQGHDRVYATDENNGFYIIDRVSGTILGRVSGLDSPNEVAWIPGTTFAVEPDTGSNRAVFVNTSTFGVKKRMPVGKFPTGVAVNGATRRVYVANRDSNTVSVIQLPRAWWEGEVQ
jgi:YVTN family beta-propeller protein